MSGEAIRAGVQTARWSEAGRCRGALALLTVLALGGAAATTGGRATGAMDPEFVTVIRAMAVIKAGLGALAFAACLWRLGRPASSWRLAAYLAGPPLIGAGALAVWNLQGLGLAAIGLHLGLFAVVAAALTDPGFIAPLSRRAEQRGVCARS